MAPGRNDPSDEPGVVSGILGTIDRRVVAMVLVGLLAGYSLSLLGGDAVAFPAVGSVPGTPVGVVGLAVAAGAYRWFGCCGDCGSKTLGVTGTCNCSDDSCTDDP